MSEYGILDTIYESVKALNEAGLISDKKVEQFYIACFCPERSEIITMPECEYDKYLEDNPGMITDCDCGLTYPHEPWWESCGLGNDEEHAVVADLTSEQQAILDSVTVERIPNDK